MRCYICDRLLEEPVYNEEVKGYEPCDPCLAIIMDTANVPDKASADEDAFTDEALFVWNPIEEYWEENP